MSAPVVVTMANRLTYSIVVVCLRVRYYVVSFWYLEPHSIHLANRSREKFGSMFDLELKASG